MLSLILGVIALIITGISTILSFTGKIGDKDAELWCLVGLLLAIIGMNVK